MLGEYCRDSSMDVIARQLWLAYDADHSSCEADIDNAVNGVQTSVDLQNGSLTLSP